MVASPARSEQPSPLAAPERLPGALQDVAERGSLLRFLPDRHDRLELTKALIAMGLIAWNKPAGKYDLTAAGRHRLARHRTAAAVDGGRARS